jgi:hypothetical protein
MEKQTLLENLKNQPDCFYSLAQVISLIESMNVSQKETEFSDKLKVTILKKLIKHLDENLSFNSTSIIDNDSVKFGIYGNRIHLENIVVNTTNIQFSVREQIVSFFDKLNVEILEKTDATPDNELIASGNDVLYDDEVEYTAGDANPKLSN